MRVICALLFLVSISFASCKTELRTRVPEEVLEGPRVKYEGTTEFVMSAIHQQADEVVSSLVETGDLKKINRFRQIFYVTHKYWQALTKSEKRQLLNTFADYCQAFCDEMHVRYADILINDSNVKVAAMEIGGAVTLIK